MQRISRWDDPTEITASDWGAVVVEKLPMQPPVRCRWITSAMDKRTRLIQDLQRFSRNNSKESKESSDTQNIFDSR